MLLDGAKVFHVNVNCRDLEQSCAFYEGLGLRVGVQTTPEGVQPGDAFGLERAQWDARILVGARGFDASAIDLLEWKVPAAAGTPPPSLHTQGFQRVGVMVPDLDAAMASVVEHRGEVWSEPIRHTDEHADVRLVLTNDPDGVAVELVEGGGPSPAFVGVVCTDLARSLDWYASIGFREQARFPSASDDAAHLRIDGRSAFDEVLLAAPGGGMSLMLVGFRTPAVSVAPARPANAVGIWRTALVVPELDSVCRGLRDLGVKLISEPVEMSMGPGLPSLRFVCLRGPDHEVIELIQQP